MISLLVSVIVCLIILAIIWHILGLLPVAEPVKTIIILLLLLICVLWLAQGAGMVTWR